VLASGRVPSARACTVRACAPGRAVLDVAECAPHAAGGPACQLAHASLVLLPCHSDDPHPGHRDAASPPL